MAREATLAAKEAQIARLETEAAQNAALAAADLKNWPRCCPMVRHDIPGEIPPNWQGPVTKAYWSYLVSPLPPPSPPPLATSMCPHVQARDD